MKIRKSTFVVDTSHSPYAKLHPLPIEDVHLEDCFWAPRLQVLQDTTLPTQFRQCEDTGRLFNFRRAAGKEKGAFRGYVFNDSDVYKLVEALAFSLSGLFNKKLYDLTQKVIADIADAQDEDGYLNSYFTFDLKKDRWTNLRDLHELYCAGHLIQAAVAFYRATDERRLLDVACRVVDHINSVFGPNKSPGTPGHPEVEMALVELYRATGHKRYLDLAGFFIDQRGRGIIGRRVHHIDHKPFRELTEIVGHAVRSLYLNCGAADIYMETGDKTLWETLNRLWYNMTERRMYVTGGAGSRHEGEEFGEDYELPNFRAYAETCAAIANVMWNWRMLLISCEARFADVIELALYNGVLSGISLDGKNYFYVNPLTDRGKSQRKPWFDCACCPPNIARLLASLPGYVYSISDEGIWVHLYVQSTAHLDVKGNPMTIIQSTKYPWDGNVKIIIEPKKPSSFNLFLRVPSWCQKTKIFINGQAIKKILRPGSYAKIHRLWKQKDQVQLSLSMPIERITSHPYVKENTDQVALKRGPLIYCIEQADNPNYDTWSLLMPSNSKLKAEWKPNLLNGIMTIRGKALAVDTERFGDQLYRPITDYKPKAHPIKFTAIPYYAWANRKSGPMTVWLRSELRQ